MVVNSKFDSIFFEIQWCEWLNLFLSLKNKKYNVFRKHLLIVFTCFSRVILKN